MTRRIASELVITRVFLSGRVTSESSRVFFFAEEVNSPRIQEALLQVEKATEV